MTRAAVVALAFVVWFGLLAIVWCRWKLRYLLLGMTVLAAGFLALPTRSGSTDLRLREAYLSALLRYNGVRYIWGGENRRGIDCSGLIRQGLIDAMFVSGIRTFNAGLVREAMGLWWNDCSARALGEQHRGLTVPISETPSVNALDHSTILPGDLAVTKSGIHIMAYLGENRWIEADPEAGEVIVLTAPSTHGWFDSPMKIVRWSVLR